MNRINISQTSLNDSSKKYSNFFKSDIDSIIIKKPVPGEAPMQFRILPSFNFDELNSEVFPTSVLPYRSDDLKKFNEWVCFVRGYTFFGELYANFLSPVTLQGSNDFALPKTDPISDLRKFIFKSNKNNATMMDGVTPLISREELILITGDQVNKIFVKIPVKPKKYAIMNTMMYNPDLKVWEPKILISSQMAFEMFTEVLKEKPGRNDPIISQNYPEFLFGDITSPKDGCIVTIKEGNSPTNTKLATFNLSDDNESLTGFVKKEIGDEELKTRKVLSDVDSVLDIWDYQKILDQLCFDPMVPTETLQKAFDAGFFNANAVLNLDLREAGLERLAERESNKKGDFHQAKADSTTSSPNAMQALASSSNGFAHHAPSANTQSSDVPQQPVAQSQVVSQPSAVQASPQANVANQGSDDPEYAEYMTLKNQAIAGSIAPASILRYVELNSKFGQNK